MIEKQEAIIEQYGKQNGWNGHGIFISKTFNDFYATISMDIIREGELVVFTVTGSGTIYGKRWECKTPLAEFNNIEEFTLGIEDALRTITSTHQTLLRMEKPPKL